MSYLDIQDLRVSFSSFDGVKNVLAIDRLQIEKGHSYGLVGESGSGKSVLALTIFGLITKPPGIIESGSIMLDGEDLLQKSDKQMSEIRGKKIAMIFQDPMSTLNPVFTVGEQIIRAIRSNHGLSKKEAQAKAVEMIETVRLPDAKNILGKYPHELSGGQRQRIIIAIALACGADFLVADEPTRNLDVTIQAGILKLLHDLQRELNVTIFFIANNLSLVNITCDKVGLIYEGRIVESGDAQEIIRHPKHPYTQTLLRPLPQTEAEKEAIKRTIAEEQRVRAGCPFQNKCLHRLEICRHEAPQMYQIAEQQQVCCHLYAKEGGAGDDRADS